MSQSPNGYFGQWLDLTLENRQIKATDLAKKCRVTDSAVSRWRSGNGTPSMRTLQRLAKALDVDAVRLAVTARIMDPDLVAIQPLPLPAPTVRRARVEGELQKIKGLTDSERQQIMNAYDEIKGKLNQ